MIPYTDSVNWFFSCRRRQFQWRKHTNANDLTLVTNIVDGTNIDLLLMSVQTNDIASYSLVVTNTLGKGTSAVAHLYVYLTEQATLTSRGFFTTQNWMEVKGITGANYVVYASTNLINWLCD